jgi:hypothetical protein
MHNAIPTRGKNTVCSEAPQAGLEALLCSAECGTGCGSWLATPCMTQLSAALPYGFFGLLQTSVAAQFFRCVKLHRNQPWRLLSTHVKHSCTDQLTRPMSGCCIKSRNFGLQFNITLPNACGCLTIKQQMNSKSALSCRTWQILHVCLFNTYKMPTWNGMPK